MALPTKDIFLRSPYWLNIDETDLDFVLCELRIWTGALYAEPVEADIKLRSTALNNKTSIDIAEYARDFVEVTYGGSDESNAVFISYQLQIFTGGVVVPLPDKETKVYLTGYDGYGTFQDGPNPSWNNEVMLTDNDITVYNETSIRIPVRQNYLTGYQLWRYAAGYGGNWTMFNEVTGLSPVENTEDMIRFVSNFSDGKYADKVVFQFSQGADETVRFSYEPCNKFGNTYVSFVNKLGTTQSMSFFGKSEISMNTNSNKYKRNILVNGDYDEKRHQSYVLNKNGTITLNLNTGWRSEEENDTMIELMLSEQVWVTVDSSKLGKGWVPKQSNEWVVPVNMKSEDTVIKNKVNDKLINYSFSFEAAYDWINNVR